MESEIFGIINGCPVIDHNREKRQLVTLNAPINPVIDVTSPGRHRFSFRFRARADHTQTTFCWKSRVIRSAFPNDEIASFDKWEAVVTQDEQLVKPEAGCPTEKGDRVDRFASSCVEAFAPAGLLFGRPTWNVHCFLLLVSMKPG